MNLVNIQIISPSVVAHIWKDPRPLLNENKSNHRESIQSNNHNAFELFILFVHNNKDYLGAVIICTRLAIE